MHPRGHRGPIGEEIPEANLVANLVSSECPRRREATRGGKPSRVRTRLHPSGGQGGGGLHIAKQLARGQSPSDGPVKRMRAEDVSKRRRARPEISAQQGLRGTRPSITCPSMSSNALFSFLALTGRRFRDAVAPTSSCLWGTEYSVRMVWQFGSVTDVCTSYVHTYICTYKDGTAA